MECDHGFGQLRLESNATDLRFSSRDAHTGSDTHEHASAHADEYADTNSNAHFRAHRNACDGH